MKSAKRVVLGVTGSIAAYKAAELVRRMTSKGWDVWVMMTEAATQYVGPLTFLALTRHPVPSGRAEATPAEAFQHLDLSSADAIVVAPCTANVMAKIAHGLADDIVSATVLATTSPVIVAPAMNEKMWLNPATQDNVRTLKRRHIQVLDTEKGELACGVMGAGRLCMLDKIVKAVEKVL
jgi:phosphopantothenoylcysteine decarboxylase/phosphopantothenate--cysteine ligase